MKISKSFIALIKRSRKLYAMLTVLKMSKDDEMMSVLTHNNNVFNVTVHVNENSHTDQIIYYLNREDKDEGFFAIVRTTLYCLHYANRLNLIPYVKWSCKCSYYDNDMSINNPFEYYFKQICTIPEDEIIKTQNIVFYKNEDDNELRKYPIGEPYHESSDFIIEMANIWKKNLVLQNSINKKINEDILDLFTGNVLGIHFRGTDFKQNYNNHPVCLSTQDYFDVLENEMDLSDYDFIFLATDDLIVLREFKEKYGDKVKSFDDNLRADGEVSAMYAKSERKYNNYLKGYEVLRDAYALARCSGIVTGKSMVSMFARVIAEVEDHGFVINKIISKGINENDNNWITSKY